MSNIDPANVPAVYDAASVGEIVRANAGVGRKRREGSQARFETNADALPRAYLVDRFDVMPLAEAVDALVAGSYDVQRGVMLLYVLNGQRAEAVRQFDRCRELLLRDCDVEPMPQTERLAALIRSGEVFDRIDTLSDSILGQA